MKLRERPNPEPEVDMTPMIDMVFLLLVFFMCAATMSKVDFIPEIALPVAPKANVPEDLRNRGTINIMPVGFEVGGVLVPEEKQYMVAGTLVSSDELTKLIQKKVNEEPDVRINMRVHRDVEFKTVRGAILACAKAGVFDIIFASYQTRVGE